jgi:AcrR family transcriptional regulator
VPRDSRAGGGPNNRLAAISSVGAHRGRPRKLDRAGVTRSALGIVERDGLGGLTMRRVADDLGVSLATLYKAAGSKEAILDDMIEEVFGKLPTCDRTEGQEIDTLRRLWEATHELLVANPIVAQLTALNPVGGAGMFALVESTLALLRAAGVADHLVTTTFEAIRSYTLGFTLLRISRSDPSAVAAEQRLAEETSRSPERFPEIIARTPDLAAAITSEHFEVGLEHLILGFLPAQQPGEPD